MAYRIEIPEDLADFRDLLAKLTRRATSISSRYQDEAEDAHTDYDEEMARAYASMYNWTANQLEKLVWRMDDELEAFYDGLENL